MRAGAGKSKGSAHERKVCAALSLWITNGERTDVFWRSAMSGGRATVAKKGGKDVRQSGDICAVAPEGHALTDQFYIECKHYRDLQLVAFFLRFRGKLAEFWTKAETQALQYRKDPMMIVKQNNVPTLIMLPLRLVETEPLIIVNGIAVLWFDEFLKTTKPPSKPKMPRPRL